MSVLLNKEAVEPEPPRSQESLHRQNTGNHRSGRERINEEEKGAAERQSKERKQKDITTESERV